MNSSELHDLACRTRSLRETGFSLLVASAILAIFLFVPLAATPTLATTESPEAPSAAPSAFATVPIEAQAAIVYDLATKQVLFEKNADAQLPLASLTKLLTVYAALSTLSPTTPVTIPPEATRVDAPRAFSTGETYALADLARLTLTASLNDGAAAIAITTAERESRTEDQMLASAAASLGLAQTYAVNGSGLDLNAAISGGYGSAYDLAVLSGALVAKAPMITYATTQPTTRAVSEDGTDLTVKNTDPVVGTIPNLLLSKTGYTDLAGGNLALVFDVGLGHPIAIVLLGSSKQARFTDGTALVAATFAHFAGLTSL